VLHVEIRKILILDIVIIIINIVVVINHFENCYHLFYFPKNDEDIQNKNFTTYFKRVTTFPYFEEKITGIWKQIYGRDKVFRILYYEEELSNLCRSPGIVRIVTFMRLCRVGHVARM